jgi:hypothetical protein
VKIEDFGFSWCEKCTSTSYCLAAKQCQLEENPEKAEALANEGMSKALKAERVRAWKAAAAAWRPTMIGREACSDDLTAAIGLPDVGPNKNNYVGALWRSWHTQGLVAPTGRRVKSKRSVRHGNRIDVWRILA